MDYDIQDIERWNRQIEKLAKNAGLDFYPQEFDIISYKDMLGYEAYVGMPSRYPHWSFGKAYERNKTLYQYNLTGLPYEMVINSNPCLAYLMKDNTLLLQILTIAHVYGHNDFFKNNRLFMEGSDADYTLEMFKSHADRIRGYINDPSIGYASVEKILDAAHALKLQVSRVVGEKRLTDEEYMKRKLEDYKEESSKYNILEPYVKPPVPDFSKIPLQPEDDLLYFLIQYGELTEWEKDIVNIVRHETLYFIPQIETKIMNEGWASYWHYTLLHRLHLPDGLHLEFIKRHNDVIAPLRGRLNPYFLGFKMFEDIEKRYGREKIFEVRKLERDESFLRRYLTKELCEELHLYRYIKKDRDYVIDDIPDDQGWKNIRDTLCGTSGMGMIPAIRVVEVSKKDKSLHLEHVFDGRELNLDYAEATLKHVVDIWGYQVVLRTNLNGKIINLICDENKKILRTERVS